MTIQCSPKRIKIVAVGVRRFEEARLKAQWIVGVLFGNLMQRLHVWNY